MDIMAVLVNGILYGGLLALVAYGVNLMFGVVEIVHFFYGQLILVGLYVVYTLTVVFGVPLPVSCLIAIVVTALLNVIVHLSMVRSLLKASLLNQFLALAAVMIILQNACQAIFGASHKGIPISLPSLSLGELYIMTGHLIVFCGSLVTIGLLYLFLYRTYTGLAIRSVHDDREAAELMGVNTGMIYVITMAIGGILAGIASGLFVPIYTFQPAFGMSFTLIAFVIVILGGMGNLLGGFISAFIVGLVTMVVATLFNIELANIVVYVVFLVIILIRPQGLLGVKTRV